MSGALAGIRIIEITGIGLAPFTGMMLADHGTEVIRIDRPGGMRCGVEIRRQADVLKRSRRSIAIDLKSAEGVTVMKDLARSADGIVEGFRPGVMERIGLGPEDLLAINPRLVIRPDDGLGADRPLYAERGSRHQLYRAAGALGAFGRAGGSMELAFGMLAGILSAKTTGRGHVVGRAMVERASILMAMIWGPRGQRSWSDARGTNMLDSGSPYYDTYETSDGLHMAVGPVEPVFYAQLLDRIGVAGEPAFLGQDDPARWPDIKRSLADLFRMRTRVEQSALLEITDACAVPVLSMAEAPMHPHNVTRDAFLYLGGVTQPALAPRFSATPAERPRGAARTAPISTGDISNWRRM